MAKFKKVAFSVRVADAREVVLTGDFTAWAKDKIRLEKGADGQWRTELKLPPGRHQYRLIVNGEWRDHVEALQRQPNPFGTQNCVLTI